MTTMQLVEQHIIDRHDPRWSAIDAACFLSKNLYNAANYILRQEYIFNHRYVSYAQLDKQMKRHPDYCALPRKTHYVVEVVYTTTVQTASVEPDRVAAIDVGLDNLATVTSNQPGFVPLPVNGRPLKAINQLYNKERARLQSQLRGEHLTSRRLDGLTDKRNRRVSAYLHLASRRIIETLVTHQIGTLVIGKNDGWKQAINLGKRTNQNFVHIPHARFVEMLTYKAQLVGIQVILTEESYTSKCSFLDREPIGKHERYTGKRVKRGLFRASDGRTINADVNGSYNIVRKVIPNAFADGIAACVVKPVRVTPREWFP